VKARLDAIASEALDRCLDRLLTATSLEEMGLTEPDRDARGAGGDGSSN
jgi:hypothetical protein